MSLNYYYKEGDLELNLDISNKEVISNLDYLDEFLQDLLSSLYYWQKEEFALECLDNFLSSTADKKESLRKIIQMMINNGSDLETITKIYDEETLKNIPKETEDSPPIKKPAWIF